MDLDLYRLGIILDRLYTYGSIYTVKDGKLHNYTGIVQPKEFGQYQAKGEMLMVVGGRDRYKIKSDGEDEYIVYDIEEMLAIRIYSLSATLAQIAQEIVDGGVPTILAKIEAQARQAESA